MTKSSQAKRDGEPTAPDGRESTAPAEMPAAPRTTETKFRHVQIVHAQDGQASLLMPRQMVGDLLEFLKGSDLNNTATLPAGVSLSADGDLVFAMEKKAITTKISWVSVDDVCFP